MPTGEGIEHGPALDALRERGAHRHDPIRFRYLEALARRAEAHGGDARRLLDDRLHEALADYAARHPGPVPLPGDAANGSAREFSEAGRDSRRQPVGGTVRERRRAAPQRAEPRPRGPLAELVRYLASQSPTQADDAAGDGAAGDAAASNIGTRVEPKALQFFRDTWSKLNVDRQLTRSLANVPGNAGPLNSHLLALRTIQSLHDISPDYVNRFMSYVDALLWLEQASHAGPPVPASTTRGDGDRKRKAGRARPR